jgi:hypothetical protein
VITPNSHPNHPHRETTLALQIRPEALQEDQLRDRMRASAILALLLAPFTSIYLFLNHIVGNAERFYHHPSSATERAFRYTEPYISPPYHPPITLLLPPFYHAFARTDADSSDNPPHLVILPPTVPNPNPNPNPNRLQSRCPLVLPRVQRAAPPARRTSPARQSARRIVPSPIQVDRSEPDRQSCGVRRRVLRGRAGGTRYDRTLNLRTTSS